MHSCKLTTVANINRKVLNVRVEQTTWGSTVIQYKIPLPSHDYYVNVVRPCNLSERPINVVISDRCGSLFRQYAKTEWLEP
jgi:hypothetical protein